MKDNLTRATDRNRFMRLRLAFMGTPDFAVPALKALVDAGHEIVFVYTQPPRQAGRGRQLRRSPVQAAAEAAKLVVRAPVSLKSSEEQAAIAACHLDAAVVVAYGLLLPKAVLMAPRLGCLNIHASLLPRWRGAAPIQRAIMAGDRETGISIMQMDEGLDTGGILLQQRIAIEDSDDAGTLHDKLAVAGAALVLQALAGLADGRLVAIPQPTTGASYAAKITRADERLDWRQPADALVRRVRALSPDPGAWFEASEERFKVLSAEAVAGAATARPGMVLDDRLTIACGSGALRIIRIQRAGRAPLAASDFLRGCRLERGTMLSPAAEQA